MQRHSAAIMLLTLMPLGCTSGAVERCAPHEELDGAECVAICADGEALLPSGRCELLCEAGEQPDDGECVAVCPEGEERYQGECVALCGALEQRVDGQCRGPSQVRVNSVGYPLDAEKIALISGDVDRVEVYSADGDVVLEVDAEGPVTDDVTGAELYTADFSALVEPGGYSVVVPGVGESSRFELSDNPYASTLELAMLGFYGLRCGTAVDFEHQGEPFAHAECHEEDALLDIGGSDRIDSIGGWHDAGDYGKYTQNAAFTVGMLLFAWEQFGTALERLEIPAIPEHGGDLPDFLDEVKWELDWLLTMQRDDGATFHKLTARNFEGFVMPENDINFRYLVEPSSEATASFVAAMAMASRVFEPYDTAYAARCLEAAERGYAFLEANPNRVIPDDSEFSTGRYLSNDADDRLWAVAELFVSTGDGDALAEFEASAADIEVASDWDWANLSNLGLFSYALSDRDGKSQALDEAIKSDILASADELVSTSDAHPFLRALGETYYWGANGLTARSMLNLGTAHALGGDEKYRRVALHQLGHLLGVNAHGRSYVTGVGFLPPLAPHHRPSGADGVDAPWPGLLVGGPNPQLPDDAAVNQVVEDPNAPAPLQWQDDQRSYWSNEVAINWNGALVYGLSWFYLP